MIQKPLQMVLGLSLLLAGCCGIQGVPPEKLAWNDPRILRGTYQGTATLQNNQTAATHLSIVFKFNPIYMDAYRYQVEGTMQLEGGAELPFTEAQVQGFGSQTYLEPQSAPAPPAQFGGTAKTHNKTYQLNFSPHSSTQLVGNLTLTDAENTSKVQYVVLFSRVQP